MMELLSCRYNMDTAIRLFNVEATTLDCISPIYYNILFICCTDFYLVTVSQ